MSSPYTATRESPQAATQTQCSQLPGADIIFQDTKVGEEFVVVIPSFTVTQLVQCEMPHACKF